MPEGRKVKVAFCKIKFHGNEFQKNVAGAKNIYQAEAEKKDELKCQKLVCRFQFFELFLLFPTLRRYQKQADQIFLLPT